jgi:hypothetical protein
MTNSDEQFAVVRVPQPGARRDSILADAVIVGNLAAVMERLPSTRARTDALLRMYRIADDAVDAEARRDAALADAARADARRDASERQSLKDEITRLKAQVDALQEELELRKRMDKAQRIRDALEDLRAHEPGPGGTATAGDGDDKPTHHPTGDLHELGPAESTRHTAPVHPGHRFDPDSIPRVPRITRR